MRCATAGWLLTLCICIPAPVALAWGDDGHRIVGEIAAQLLSSKTRTRLERLWPNPSEASLADAAVWADSHARAQPRYRFANKLHYVNVPAEAERYRGRHCPDKCVVSAIEHYGRVLHDDDTDRATRLEALRFLVHFVGDLHQPLHVAHPDGRGGTRTEIRFLGQSRNLHWVWDTGLVEVVLKRRGAGWQSVATELRESLTASRREAWSKIDPNAWATESLRVAQAHAFLEAGQRMDANDADAMRPRVERQLLKAGVRLAALLEATLADVD